MKNIPVLLLILLPVSLLSQKAGSYIGITTGVSIPLGKFSSKTLDGGSFALPGWNINLEGAWFFYKNLGAGIEVGYDAHPVDVVSLATEKVAADPFLEELIIRSDPYREITLAGHLHYSFSLSERFFIIPKAGGGILYGFSPYQLHKAVYYLVGSRWFEITSTRDWGGYFSAGASFRYRLNDCIDLMINSEFGYSLLKYRFLTGTGEIREDIHHILKIDGLAGISINF